MNAITQTFADLSSAIASFTTPVATVGDVAFWLAEQGHPRPLWFARSLYQFTGKSPLTPLSEAKASLTRVLERERRRGKEGHWSYDMNRQIALRQLLDAVEKFEARA